MLELLVKSSASKQSQFPILFIHGAWHAAWCWEENFMPYFSDQGFDTYALSLSNHGQTIGEKSLPKTRMHHYVEDVRKAVQKIGGNLPVLIGHSMGGLVVQKYLEKYPCKAAVLMAAIPPKGALGFALRDRKKQPIGNLFRGFKWDLSHMLATHEQARYYLFTESLPNEKVDTYRAKLGGEAIAALLMDALKPNIKREKQHKVPMLVLGAGKDALFSERDIVETAAFYECRMKMFDHMAHDLMLEKDWQIVADFIIDWVNREVI